MSLFWRAPCPAHKQFSAIWVSLWLALWSGSCAAYLPIEAIQIEGNTTTQARIILQEMFVGVGDPADPARIKKSRQAIMDLGLFKSVRTALREGTQGQILTISVSEKYYFFPIPKLKRSPDGDISYGAQLRFDNLAGLNQKLKLTYKTERNCCTQEGNRNATSLDYESPRIGGTHYDLKMGLEYTVGPFDVSENGAVISEYQEKTEGATFSIRRWLNRTGPSVGWSVRSGWFWKKQKHEYVSGVPNTANPGHAAGLTFSISHKLVHDYLFSRGGSRYGYDLRVGMTQLGSDATYSTNKFYYRRYWPVGQRPHQNLNFQLQLGFSGGTLVLGDYAFSVGGSRTLRALDKGSRPGRSFFAFNIEYLTPLFNQPAFRGVAFFDIGNAYYDNRIIDFGDLDAGPGFGIRYRLKSFVNLQIRVDVAYNLETAEKRSYIGTRNSF